MMSVLSTLFINAQPWKVFAIAFLLGALGTLAFEPFSWFFMAFFSLSGLLWLLNNSQSTSWKHVFAIGWWFGLGHFTTGLYWIAFAMSIDLQQFGWLIPFALLGLPAVLSFFIAPVTLLTHMSRTKALTQLFYFSMLWAIFEWLRGHVLTGLPWNLIGYIWMDYDLMNQSLSLFGAYGLSLITVFIAGLPFLSLETTSLRNRIFYSSIALILLISLGTFGKWRLFYANDGVLPNICLRLVQPNIPQRLKWDHKHLNKNFEHLLFLTSSPAQKPITHILWPEAAVPCLLEYDHGKRHRVASVIPSEGALMTGGVRLIKRSRVNIQAWNSIFVITPDAQITDIYDKSHLVPFGEYVPMRSFFPSFVKKVTAGSTDFSSGTGPRTLKVKGLPPFSPLVCYEGIFPGEVKEKQGERPQWIYNATNDAWFGPTSGPYQHLAINRARAIEEGLPYIRVANTGISAVIDAYGRVKASLPLNTEGTIDTELPLPSSSLTLYSLYGDRIFFGLLVFFSLLFLGGFLSHRRCAKRTVK